MNFPPSSSSFFFLSKSVYYLLYILFRILLLLNFFFNSSIHSFQNRVNTIRVRINVYFLLFPFAHSFAFLLDILYKIIVLLLFWLVLYFGFSQLNNPFFLERERTKNKATTKTIKTKCARCAEFFFIALENMFVATITTI